MSLPKYLNKEDSPQKQGRKQEKRARQHINSGAVWFDQFDLDQLSDKGNFLIDVKKAVKQKQVAISEVKVKKLFTRAMDENKTPAYLIYLGDYIIKAIVEKNPDWM